MRCSGPNQLAKRSIVRGLDNPGSSPIQTQVTLKSPAITFPAGDTRITVAANVLGKLTPGKRTYYVLYGRSGEPGRSSFCASSRYRYA